MNHIDLFSGIGGFALAARNVWGEDHNILSFVEIESFPQGVLKKNFPGVKIHGDIKTFDAKQYRGAVDLLTGGFPCQPYSIAGKQKGAADDRNLWPEMFRVIQETRPTWIIGENVANITGFLEFENIMVDLESEKYEVWPVIIPACAVDAPHRRDRVWIVANTDGKRQQEQRADEPEQPGLKRDSRRGIKPGLGRVANGVSYWLDEPREAPRVTNKKGNRVARLKALGNAIVPQVAEKIMIGIKEL